MNAAMIGMAMGGSQPHGNMQPYLVMNWVIALNGIWPPRS
jgi:microcystin-dependent protein